MKTITRLVFVLSISSMVVLAVANNSAKPDGTRLACDGGSDCRNVDEVTPDKAGLKCNANDSNCNEEKITPDGTRLACNGGDDRCNEEKITPDGTRLACDGNSGCNVDEVAPFETSANI